MLLLEVLEVGVTIVSASHEEQIEIHANYRKLQTVVTTCWIISVISALHIFIQMGFYPNTFE
jgi:hypothetical protein